MNTHMITTTLPQALHELLQLLEKEGAALSVPGIARIVPEWRVIDDGAFTHWRRGGAYTAIIEPYAGNSLLTTSGYPHAGQALLTFLLALPSHVTTITVTPFDHTCICGAFDEGHCCWCDGPCQCEPCLRNEAEAASERRMYGDR